MNAPCHVCLTIAESPFTCKNGHDVYKCRACGFMYVWPTPVSTDAVYSEEYFQGAHSGFGYVNYQEDKAGMRSTFERFLEKVNAAAPHKGLLLDVGAATGFFMSIAKEDGWQVKGVEISEWASQTGRDSGLDVVTGLIQDAHFRPETFDAVTFWDVFEHVPNPRAELGTVKSILKPSGILAMNMPDGGSWFARLMGSHWHSFVPPEHLNYFNPRSLRMVLESEGFDVLQISKIGKRFTLQYIFQTLARWQKLGIWRWCAARAKHTFWGRWYIPLNLRDNVFVIARKRS
jgi:SAM-dependent methyltransferase